MDSLDFNLHQLVLTDLALNISTASKDEESLQSGIDLIASRVVLRSKQAEDDTKYATQDRTSNGIEEDDQQPVYISAPKVHCHIAYGHLAVNLPAGHLESAIPVLIDILRDIPHVQLDPSLNWTDWALPDQLVYSTVTALLKLASRDGTPREHIIGSIISFVCDIVSLIKGTGEVISHGAPAFHGLYRAVISTSFSWSITEWLQLSQALSDLLDADLVEHFGNHLTAAIDSPQEQAILSRYITANRPLTGYFILCCIMEIEWTVLAQNLQTTQVSTVQIVEEAAAANAAWGALASRKVASPPQVRRDIGEGLRKSIDVAMQCFTDLLTQMESLETEPSSDTYAWETMAESIKLSAVCSVALQEIDQGLLSRIRLLLSESSPVYDALVQEAALEATIVLLHNFKSIAPSMASHLRKFISNPLPIFEFHLMEETHAPPLLLAIAQCLALAIQLSPGDDLIMSTMYSLLNFIAVTSKEQGTAPRGEKAKEEARDDIHIAFGTFDDNEKRILGISTICVVTHLALEVRKEEVTRLTISMLLQHIRTAEPSVEAAIAFNLVHLALVVPRDAFVDIIRAFCFINRTTRIGEDRQLNDMVLAAQTRLAQKMNRRPDFYNVYLLEILALFADKGIAIQTAATSNATDIEMNNLMAELCSLLLPIDALLDHTDFHPGHSPSSLLTTRFRNMWFICVLFNFTPSPQRASCMTDWHIGALSRIAEKTPPIVLEEAYDFITTDLEFNPVLREDYLEKTAAMHKATLTKYIPLKSSDIKALIPAQVVFLLALHDLEAMRSSRGYVASITTYFLNKGVNSRESLSSCMDSIVEKVIRGCLNELNTRVMQHSLPVTISSELQKLLVASCHRIARARDIAGKYLHRMITSLPSLMCDEPLVCAILEVLTLLRRACEGEYTDEYNPAHHFTSARSNLTIELTDSYATRNEILVLLHKNANYWLALGISRAPIEVRRTLQKYLAFHESIILPDVTELGAALALQYSCRIQPDERSIVPISGPLSWTPDRSKVFAAQLAAQERFAGEARGIGLATKGVGTEQIQQTPPPQVPSLEINALISKLRSVADEIHHHTSKMTMQDFKRLLFRTASALITIPESELVQELVALPFVAFTQSSIAAGIEAWTWLIGERSDLEISLMTDISEAWAETIKLRKGLFSPSMNFDDPFNHPVEYSATDKALIDRTVTTGKRLLGPHTQLLRMLRSRFQAVRYRRPGLMLLITRLVLKTTRNHKSFSTQPLAREARFSFLIFGFEVLRSSSMDTDSEARLRDGLYQTALSWFAVRPQWSYGANRVQIDADIKLLNEFLDSLQADAVRGMSIISSRDVGAEAGMGPEYFSRLKSTNTLLRLLVENEIFRLNVWNNPSGDKRSNDQTSTIERNFTESSWANAVRMAWTIEPAVAVHLAERFKQPIVRNEVAKHIKADPKAALDVAEALSFLLGDRLDPSIRKSLKFLHLWRPVPPVLAISYFSPRYGNDSIVLQYAHRVLAGHPVDLTFFFVPQVVQALRHDPLGYVERFIFETAKISQLFCHQTIWNMKANCYKGDAGEIEDPMKPMLDRVTEMVVESLSGDAREFYDREFGFFNEVTSISGKLKPFIKRTKQEKKAKIDEEMAKIVVKVGVYLPSNPDGRVVDIDKKSGRPLQSHAKAPFMATFMVRKEKVEVVADLNAVIEGEEGTEKRTVYDAWVQAIFKVGDDCRQDLLALQVIAMFKNIFTSVGLTLFVLPYRVTATGPGMGVIDVVPNATSRDEMGRAKINDLLAFFIAKFGSEDTVAFQQARLNFIQSMAAYSVVCYILQIKDRHNGNIMIDGYGHIVHVDFGFLFDIAPGGVKFEPNSFKLNREMVVLMGGRASEGYALFTHLTIKAFLAIRPHAPQIVEAIHLMLGTGLPSFKGEPTIRRLRDRFALHLNERQAAEWMSSIIRNAYENVRSTIYDEFQRVQNGIPYA